MEEVSKNDLITMKFLHYFITDKNYNPVIVHGIQNEIWLENMDNEYKIIRIVTNYIHNEEQLNFDMYKVSKLIKQIKMKTFTYKMKVISFYLDINEDVKLIDDKNNVRIRVNKEEDIFKNNIIKNYFSDISSKFKFTEEGNKLYEKINRDIISKNISNNQKINDIFTPKKPVVTYILVGIISIFMALMYIIGRGSTNIETLFYFGGLVKGGSFVRVIISMFLHIGIIHFIMNVWALIIIGKQTESFYGHIKMLIIFLYSGIIGNLLSLVVMNKSTITAGASGAIFGLMGSLLYFAINQRTYMGQALKNDILPVIIVNLILGSLIPSINLVAHIGGLIGGIIISMALGIKYKFSKTDKINGIICSLILFLSLFFIVYIK